MMIVVYVLALDRTPLMPCTPVIARLLLKDGKAKVIRRTPFTIKLLAQAEERYTQPLTLGVDTGSSVIGSAVADQNGHVVYLSEVEVRNDIALIMKERSASRRNRRRRKTRYLHLSAVPREIEGSAFRSASHCLSERARKR